MSTPSFSLYQLKPAFQAQLRPTVHALAARGVSANTVTLTALGLSLGLGALLLVVGPQHPGLFALLPLWMLLRMALNAIDGMLAREWGQASALGAYLNELSDVLADAALIAPFARIAPFDPVSIAGVIFLATVSEMTGALGPMVGAPRQYDGPMGKSDRAALFGALALLLALHGALPSGAFWLLPAVGAAITLGTWRRLRSGVRQAHPPG